jgi:hypothetical protein
MLSRPYGTFPIVSWVPRTGVLGYSQPSLRDWSRYTLIADLFSASPVQIGRSKKASSDKTDSLRGEAWQPKFTCRALFQSTSSSYSMHRRLRCEQTHLLDFHVFVDLRVLEGEAG